MKLTFLGAAGEVTGSSYLVETGGLKFLIDCGMFQGGREAEAKNRRAFACDPREIAFVLLSHAHIDHSGLIPRLAARGFRGAVYATRATCELLGVMLPDSGHLQEREAQYDRRGRAPLYTAAEASASLRHLVPVEYGAVVRPHAQVSCVFRDAGHILGSAIVEVEAGGAKIVFSGDLGQPGHPIVRDPTPVAAADVLLIESTYGDRLHKSLTQTLDEFAFALNDTLASRRGNVVIPAFAVGRTQDILYFISELRRQKRVPAFDVYVDSPMAVAATRITLAHPELQDRESLRMDEWLKGGPGGRVHFTEDVEDSKRINSIRSGAVIISASGMCDGGRIKHHLKYNISRPECAIVFVGFQAAGSLGRRIVDGAKRINLYREPYPVRAKLFTIGGLSAHADRDALLGWLGNFRAAPRQCWVVHGEPLAAHSLRDEIERRYGWRAAVPAPRRTVEL
ncbi:MAG: MBL fold metallo-hydrolase [Burkholderiales bacterium]